MKKDDTNMIQEKDDTNLCHKVYVRNEVTKEYPHLEKCIKDNTNITQDIRNNPFLKEIPECYIREET
jgi:hypothetical protein